jgi:hypothetical protein
MKSKSLLIALFIVSGLLQAPTHTSAQMVMVETEYRSVLLELIEVLQQQIALLLDELQIQEGMTETISQLEKEHFSSISSDDVIVTYLVSNASDIENITNDTYRQYFSRVLALMPQEYSEQITQFTVFSGDYQFDAYVETVAPLHQEWQYAIHKDMIGHIESPASTELILHELAHIISYEEIIGIPKPAVQTCVGYFDLSGCPLKNSFLYQFASTFWSDADIDRALLFRENKTSLNEMYHYYQNNQAKFVTDYAVSSPEEDFAETFVYFVLNLPVNGGIVEQKINFFQQSSKLRTIKIEIIDNV